MWQKAMAPGGFNWQLALDYCANLELGPYSGWRLPAVNELSTLIDSNSGSTIDTTYFPPPQAPVKLSSATHAYFIHDAWYVNFYNDFVGSWSKTVYDSVRAVRGAHVEKVTREPKLSLGFILLLSETLWSHTIFGKPALLTRVAMQRIMYQYGFQSGTHTAALIIVV